jgi:hypothetical protein
VVAPDENGRDAQLWPPHAVGLQAALREVTTVLFPGLPMGKRRVSFDKAE